MRSSGADLAATVLAVAGSFLTVVSGIASVVMLAARAVLVRRIATPWWLAPWSGFALILTACAAATGGWASAGTFVVGAVLLAGASVLVRAPARDALRGLVAAGVVLTFAAALQPILTARTWIPYAGADIQVVGLHPPSLVNRARRAGGGPAGFRSFRLHDGGAYEAVWEARTVSLPPEIPADASGVPPNRTAATVEVTFPYASGAETAEESRARITPPGDWTEYVLSVTAPDPRASRAAAILRLHVREGVVLETRNVRLRAASADVAPPSVVTGPTRASLHLGAPNLLGHAAAVAALAILALAGAPRRARDSLPVLLGLVCFGWLIYRSGSRSAWLGLAVGIAIMALPGIQRRGRGWLLLLAGAATIGLGAVATWIVRSPGLSDQPDRLTVFTRAWEALAAHPWTGIAPIHGTFERWWLLAPGADAGPAIQHAHNLWLHMAAMHGVWGAIAALWLTTWFLLLAIRLAGGAGAALVGAAFAMNLFDVSFLFFAVQLPILLALNSGRGSPSAFGARTGW